jgi:shikimate dehydrogenase
MGLDCTYVPLPVKAERLKQALAGFEAIGLVGFNVTIPHKQTIMSLLSQVSPMARVVGAVNTVWWNGQGWSGTNTDIAGFLGPLNQLDHRWSEMEVVVLGNGGAARAVVMGCFQLDFAAIHVVGRDTKNLKVFHKSWDKHPLALRLQTHTWDTLPKLLPAAGLVVNTTPVGMFPNTRQSPLDPAQVNKIRVGSIVYDLIYTPTPTCFLQIAQQHGLLAIDGLEMLVQQGAAALEVWTQRQAPVDVMREALAGHFQLT